MSDSPTPPDPEAEIAQLMAYLEQHRAQYDVKVLRQQLLKSGHPHQLVDEALRRLNGGKASPGKGTRLFGCFWSIANWLLIGAVVDVVGIPTFSGIVTATFSAVIGVLLVELLIALAARNSPGREQFGHILLWTVIWTFVLAAIGALLFGACIALLSGNL